MPSEHDDFAPSAALRMPEPRETIARPSTKPNEPALAEDGLPILKTYAAEDVDSRVEALHLVADSVAQQRTIASTTLLYHPATVAILILAFALIRQAFYTGDVFDYVKIGMTWIGAAMSVMGGIRWAAGPYVEEAERVGTWKWLDRGRSREEEDQNGSKVLGEQDEILITKFGAEEIGAIIFRGVQPISPPSSPSSKRSRKANDKQTKMQIRGWTVKQKYRRKGVGEALVEEAIKVGDEKGWTVGGVEFAPDHANSRRIFPDYFNGQFRKQDRIAHKVLERNVQESQVGNKGRRKR